MRPTEWMGKFLANRSLDMPDGRILFQYRLSDSEFEELFELLKFTTQFGINHIPTMLSWDAAFVLYASEWWRRKYCGHWGWQDIFGSIGVDYQEFPVGARNDLVETGLRRWRRKVRNAIGYRNFLGTIATEGGLPLHQLSGTDSGGWLRHILQPVLRKHIEKGHSFSALIEAYSDLIPRSYRSVQLSEILEDIADAVVTLRDENNLAGKETPIIWLDENKPQWRETFPLPVDDSAARSLLRDLIDTAAKAKKGLSSTFPFECDRILINAEFANPELIAQIELPSFVTLESIGLNLHEDLPSTMELEVFEPDGKSWPWCRSVLTVFKRERALKLSGRNFKIKGLDATSELKVRLKSRGQHVSEVDVSGGELVDLDSPWLFKKVDEKWTLHGIATQSIRDPEALVYSPAGFELQTLDESSALTSLSQIFTGMMWRLKGSVSCTNSTDKFNLRTGYEDTSSFFKLSGQRFLYASTPKEVFIGFPRLIEKNILTGVTKKHIDTRVLAKPVGQSNDGWKHSANFKTGVYQLRVLDHEKNILFSRTVGILNKNYSHTLKPDRDDVCRGILKIAGMRGVELSINQPGINIAIVEDEDVTSIDLHTSHQPPRSVDVSLLARHQSRGLTLSYPFPSRGAMLFDASGNFVSTTKSLNLQDIHGHRIRIFNDKAHLSSRIALAISLNDAALPSADQRDIYIKVPLKLSGEYFELAVTDWLSMIKSLFGVAKSLDAEVRITLILNLDTLLAFGVRRYEHLLTWEEEEGTVQINSQDLRDIAWDDLNQSEVLALNLENPNMQPVKLEAITSQDVHVGSWEFVPWARKPGPWIIYPSPESKLKFRALLWTVSLNSCETYVSNELVKNLAEAISIPNETYRRDAITSQLQIMASDHEHNNWHYLEELWQRTSHLPLATFDIWLVAIQVPIFLAALFIKERYDILEKLEEELPVIWELVSKAEWELVLQAYKSRLEQHLGDDVELVDDLLGQIIEKISSHTSSMLSMATILNSTIRGQEAPELKLMALPIPDFLKPKMEEFYQELFRRQAEQEWPPMMRFELSNRFSSLPKEFQSILEPRNTYQQSVVYLPFVLAWNAIVGDDDEWCKTSSQIFKVLQIKMFDEDWFNGAFQYLSGWLSQQQFTELDTHVE